MSFSQPHIQSTSPMDTNGVVRCSHGEAAIIRTSQTSSNPNREFYTCSRSIQSERCKFFYWVDDPIFSRQPVSHFVPATAIAPASSRPPSSPKTRAESAQTSSTPHKSPRKRIADIAAALNESEPQDTSTQHGSPQQNTTAMNDRMRSFLFGSQSSQASTVGDWEETSLEDEPEQSSPIRGVDQSLGNIDHRTPKKPRITSAEQRSGVQIPFPLTPPQTIRRRFDNSDQGIPQTDFPQTPTRNKGKERENSGGEQTVGLYSAVAEILIGIFLDFKSECSHPWSF
ncbi:uncharacterized protein EDB93DRAFT_215082 [Suillus bovinus]|uniref:uncharacterized protein n=1 Tax=Suillus bovinus TaxID=48563 RepID=UPI001B87DC78|nr:uncharacterized protein EDB93DRAFT_215082 [Suillus bovinus]KAG2153783.1 hypothetical protein EDB93DRAFT_215082 [Suillus bovinus]